MNEEWEWTIPGMTIEATDAYWTALADQYIAAVEAQVDAVLAACPDCRGEL